FLVQSLLAIFQTSLYHPHPYLQSFLHDALPIYPVAAMPLMFAAANLGTLGTPGHAYAFVIPLDMEALTPQQAGLAVGRYQFIQREQATLPIKIHQKALVVLSLAVEGDCQTIQALLEQL